MAVRGGPAIPICRTGGYAASTWTAAGSIVYAEADGALRQVPAEGGTPEPLRGADADAFYRWPEALPDGRHVLVATRGPADAGPRVAVVSLQTGAAQMLMAGTYPKYLDSGHLVFWRDGALWAVGFDAGRRDVLGSPAPVIENVRSSHQLPAPFAVSSEGSLVLSASAEKWVLAWMGIDGSHEPVLGVPGAYHDARLSPEGDRLALSLVEDNQDVWLHDLGRGTEERVTE